MKGENYMILLIDVEKSLKIHHPFYHPVIKIPNNLRGTYLNITKHPISPQLSSYPMIKWQNLFSSNQEQDRDAYSCHFYSA